MWPSAEQVGEPLMVKGGVTGRVDDGQDRGAPLGVLAGLGDLGIDGVDHQIEQFGSVDYVVVEPHRTDTELFGDLANRQSVEAVRVGKPDRRSGDLRAAQRHRRRPRLRLGPSPNGQRFVTVRCIHKYSVR